MQNRGRRTALIPPGTQLLPEGFNSGIPPSIGDLHHEVQQSVQQQQQQQQLQPQPQPQQRQLVYLKRLTPDPDGYINNYLLTMKKSDWDIYRDSDFNTVITKPIYYNVTEPIYQTFKRGDLAMETRPKAIQYYKKTGAIPAKADFDFQSL